MGCNMVMQLPVAKSKKPRRNDPCPCGSGKKWKACCMKTQAKLDKEFHALNADAAKELQERIRVQFVAEIRQHALSAQEKVKEDGQAAVFTEAEKMALLMMSNVAIHRVPDPKDPTRTVLSTVYPCQLVVTPDGKIGVWEGKPTQEDQKGEAKNP